jgi:hypothetical protein
MGLDWLMGLVVVGAEAGICSGLGLVFDCRHRRGIYRFSIILSITRRMVSSDMQW